MLSDVGASRRNYLVERGVSGLIPVFTVTIFISAVLLFSVQPMVGKMVLPLLGGSPAVWNTCMVFFQAALLAGYAYAHGSVLLFGVKRQAVIHIAVLLLPLLVLPIVLGGGSAPPVEGSPVPWLLGRLAMSVGLPFLIVSTSAPLLQRWFSATNHPSAGDPYFLYAASNLGSLLALVGYPLIIEPSLTLSRQSAVWSAGYGLLIVAAVGCAGLLWLTPRRENDAVHDVAAGDASSSPSARDRMWWIVLSFAPSSLMLGVTAHVTTDIAAVPLLWVAPLALYLLTFVLVFARRQWISVERMSWFMPYLFLPLALLMFGDLRKWAWMAAPIHMFAFFVAAMVCHGRLAERRPAAKHLTEYFLLISVGGVLGGLFNAIVAPLMFSRIIEYPLVLVLVCLLRPAVGGARAAARDARRDVWIPLAVGAVALAVVAVVHSLDVTAGMVMKIVIFGGPAMVFFAAKDRPVRFGLGFGVMLVTLGIWNDLQRGGQVFVARNFYGVKRVLVNEEKGIRTLLHGVTQHGFQSTDPARQREPLAYYHRRGPLGDVFASLERHKNAGRRVGIVGLGTGTIACYAAPGDRFDFYEIDPIVVRLAEDPSLFTFLEKCAGKYTIVLGDGRQTIGSVEDGVYDLIVIDAFSSDAVPTHLITTEAVELYRSKLAAGGMIALHVSNRYLSFEPMLGNLAESLGMSAAGRAHVRLSTEDEAAGVSPSHWLVMVEGAERLDDLLATERWNRLEHSPGVRVWTDQYCDVIGLFISR